MEKIDGGRITVDEFERRAAALRPSLLAAAGKLVGSDAEDMVQDALMAAHQAITRYQEVDAECFAKWLHRVLHNQCLSLLRRRRIENSVSWHSLNREERERAETGWANLATDQDRGVTNQAELLAEARLRLRFTTLREADRRCLQFRMEGISFARIARALGRPVGTVHRHVRRAIRQLRACPLAAVAAPEIEHYIWRLGSQACVYHAPEKTGAALDREKLRKMR